MPVIYISDTLTHEAHGSRFDGVLFRHRGTRCPNSQRQLRSGSPNQLVSNIHVIRDGDKADYLHAAVRRGIESCPRAPNDSRQAARTVAPGAAPNRTPVTERPHPEPTFK
jgi:hypothetical protein